MKISPNSKKKRKPAGFGLVEAVIALTLLTGLSYALLRENVNLIREKHWSVRLILARGQMNFYEAQARSADKAVLSNNNPIINPWARTPDTAVPEQVVLGSWPESNEPIYAYLTRSKEVISGDLYLQQSIIFRAGSQFYQISSTISR